MITVEIALVCTGRGSHDEWVFQSWSVDLTTTVDAMLAAVWWSHGASWVEFACGGRVTLGVGPAIAAPGRRRRSCRQAPRPSIESVRGALGRVLTHAQTIEESGQRVAIDISKANW